MFLAESSCRKCPSNSSAGGQLEHPSEVNSSTTTALRGTPASVVLATTIETQIAAAARIATAKVRPMPIRCTIFLFVTAVSNVRSNRVLQILPFSKLFRHPTPLKALLLQTKGKVQFDRAVTERSKALFRVQSASNWHQF